MATKSPNAWGLYDMAGNAMEWVNDWKGTFPRDTIEDFAGQDIPSDVPEVPLKGGAYAYGLAHLRPSSRSATYAAYRSSRAEYVGFRLARGAFSPRYRSSTGVTVFTPPVTLVRTDVARLMGALEARIVFVNRHEGRGTLTWIDYGESNPVARSLLDSLPVFHPSISPDGRWVAWSTGLEGSTGPSRIRARRLARNDTTVLDLGAGAIPRWWVSGTDTFLVRASALDNTSPDWRATKTTARRWSGAVLTGSEETWSSSGGYHDGRSGPYLYTGYRRLRQRDTRTGMDRILFTGPGNGKGAGDTSQVCNVSASPDVSGRALFLDFGHGSVSTVVGRPYGIHEVGFVSDSTGRIVRQIPAPIGERQWEHMEWSNSSRWAVSGSIDATGSYRNVYLVDLDSTKSTRILSGQELWQPAMWTGAIEKPRTPQGLAMDSLGRYEVVGNPANAWMAPYALEFGTKASAYWMENDSIEIALVGSSRMAHGGMKTSFSQGRAFNWGVSGQHTFGDIQIVTNYFLPHSPRLKAVVLSIMPGWFMADDGTKMWSAVSSGLGSIYDRNHGYWKDSLPTGFTAGVLRNASNASLGFIATGEWETNSNGWGGPVPQTDVDVVALASRAGFLRNLVAIGTLADTLASRGVLLVLVEFPRTAAYRNTPYADLYGPTWQDYALLLDSLESIAGKRSNVRLLDAFRSGAHDFDSLDFYDATHLSANGGRKLSRRLDSLLKASGIGPR